MSYKLQNGPLELGDRFRSPAFLIPNQKVVALSVPLKNWSRHSKNTFNE